MKKKMQKIEFQEEDLNEFLALGEALCARKLGTVLNLIAPENDPLWEFIERFSDVVSTDEKALEEYGMPLEKVEEIARFVFPVPNLFIGKSKIDWFERQVRFVEKNFPDTNDFIDESLEKARGNLARMKALIGFLKYMKRS